MGDLGSKKTFGLWINSLAFLEVDEPWASNLGKPPDLQAVVDFLCAPGMASDLDSLIGRYRQISQEPLRLFAAPAEENLLAKLVWPLRQAKASYMVGNYLGTIALCGMVAEMMTILLFEISDITVDGKPINDEAHRAVYWREFERLYQERRVDVLSVLGLVDKAAKSHLRTIRLVRNRYLHYFAQNHSRLPEDAVAVFNAAASLVVTSIGASIGEKGHLQLDSRVVRYLERTGTAGEAGRPTSGQESESGDPGDRTATEDRP